MTPDFLDSFGFFAGVPDSRLKALCDWLMDKYGLDPAHHVIAANEGNACAMAAGYYLATGKIPVVYMQNSGLGNAVNPIASLLNDCVYGIPCLFIIGWRGEPGVHDEPQHIFQGTITLPLLHNLDIAPFILSRNTEPGELASFMRQLPETFAKGKSAALVVREGALNYGKKAARENGYSIRREDAIKKIALAAASNPIVATTGKTSRELYEIRDQAGVGHQHDFLTVGSMGHCSSIALGLATQLPEKKIWCLDGDGAALMHMGAMPAIGALALPNLVHIVINNASHESVGGQPTVANKIDLPAIARACGYGYIRSVATMPDLDAVLEEAKNVRGPVFLEIKCALGSRADLGRPAISPRENKLAFMRTLGSAH